MEYKCKNVTSGYYVGNLSRIALLQWVNSILGRNIRKVDDLCSGSEYCQMFNILFPGIISMQKVNFTAASTIEFWSNFKQLELGFRAVKCNKEVPIQLLIKGRYKDNFQFLQWFKKFFDGNCNDNEKSSNYGAKIIPGVLTKQPSISKVKTTVEENQVIKEMQDEIELYKDIANCLRDEIATFLGKYKNVKILCKSNPDNEFAEKILQDIYGTQPEEIEILKVANADVESYWLGLIQRALDDIDVKQLITNVGDGAAPASGITDAAEEQEKEENNEELFESDDDDVAFALFD